MQGRGKDAAAFPDTAITPAGHRSWKDFMRSFPFYAVSLSCVFAFTACDFLPGPTDVATVVSGSGDPAATPSQPSQPSAPADSASSTPGTDVPADPVTVNPPPPAPLPSGSLSAMMTGSTPWRNGFEDQASSCWGARSSSGYATSSCGEFGNIGSWGAKLESNGIRHSGTNAMSVTYAKNEDVAGASLTLNADVVDVRAWYYFGTGYDFGQGVKIARVQSFNPSTQMNDIDMVMTVRSSGGANQCGTTDMSDLGMFFNGRPVGFDWGNLTANKSFQRNRWYAIEYQVSLNTPGQSNGWVKVWVDGVPAASKTGLNIRGNGGSIVKINRVRLGGWYSNSANGNSCASPSQPSTMYIDDLAVGTSYIGPN
jgi:hypothetical protein